MNANCCSWERWRPAGGLLISRFCNSPASRRRSQGFTLIEVVISSALMALILVSAYLCLGAGIKGRNIVEPRADIFQNARVAMALLTADLRGACPLSPDSAFLGMKRTIGEVEADNLDFATHNHTPRRPREGDFCEVSYYVEPNPQSGRFSLWRRRNPTLAPDPLSGGSKEEIAEDILGVRFEYSDGLDWYDNWGEVEGKAKAANSQRQQSNLEGMPNAVRITLMLDSNPKSKTDPQTGKRIIEPPLVFQTVARLNLAGAAQTDTGTAGGNSTQTTGDQSAPGTQNGGGNPL
jgi:prepilin-type N-terminal cleavage/methylation domain-containing protein